MVGRRHLNRLPKALIKKECVFNLFKSTPISTPILVSLGAVVFGGLCIADTAIKIFLFIFIISVASSTDSVSQSSIAGSGIMSGVR